MIEYFGKILVSEDDPLLRHLLAEGLLDANLDVIEAATALEAIAYLTTREASLVITDVRMPGTLDGTDVAAYSKRRYPQTPVIVISAYQSISLPMKPDLFMQKPFDVAELVSEARRLLASKQST